MTAVRSLSKKSPRCQSSNALGTEEAKRFDLLMFSLELALLKGSKRFDMLRKQLREIASALEEQTGIPAIAHQAALIEEIQTEQWWEGITVPLLELVRLRLRDLVQHIEKGKKAIVYSNFADEIGEGVELDLPQVGEVDFARFKQKARHFLKAHEDHIVLHKLRQGKPLTPTDLGELEKMLLDAGIGEAGDIERARETSQGFGRFVRSLVGLDRAAVNEAFGEFLATGTATATQIELINMIIEHLTDQGTMDPALLYEPPFTDIAPTGPERVFDEARVARLFSEDLGDQRQRGGLVAIRKSTAEPIAPVSFELPVGRPPHDVPASRGLRFPKTTLPIPKNRPAKSAILKILNSAPGLTATASALLRAVQ